MYVSEISTRLSRGMSTPAILAIFSSNFSSNREVHQRATTRVPTPLYSTPAPTGVQCLRGTGRPCLTLSLFMLWIFTTDNHYDTIAADYLAVFTTRFYRCAYFHVMPSLHYRYKMFQFQSQMRRRFM